MYNKKVYEDWELHQDATQLEINYKFYVKIVEILDVNSLLQYTSRGEERKITDKNIVEQWQRKKLVLLNEQYHQISSTEFPNNVWYDNKDIFVSSLFKAGFILCNLKLTNYKAQQSEAYYEPSMFRIASQVLSISNFEEWIASITNSILHAPLSKFTSEVNVNWDIEVTSKVKNTFWFLENMCLTFRDISNWYHQEEIRISKSEAYQYQHDILNNILNHWVIYALSDFYVKYIYDQNTKISYQKLYEVVLGLINGMIKEQTFAVIGFKAIASFMNRMLKLKAVKEDDSIINNFIAIIEITCSSKNRDKLIEIIFDQPRSIVNNLPGDHRVKEIYYARKGR